MRDPQTQAPWMWSGQNRDRQQYSDQKESEKSYSDKPKQDYSISRFERVLNAIGREEENERSRKAIAEGIIQAFYLPTESQLEKTEMCQTLDLVRKKFPQYYSKNLEKPSAESLDDLLSNFGHREECYSLVKGTFIGYLLTCPLTIVFRRIQSGINNANILQGTKEQLYQWISDL